MNISDYLIDPISKIKLDIDWEKGTIYNLNNDFFEGKSINGIPVILPKKNTLPNELTDLHKSVNSQFDYVDHYMKDAELFDYFQKSDDITENERNRLNQLIVKKISKDSKMILDVGCGNGWLSKMVQNNTNYILSLDISYTNVERVIKEKAHPNHKGLVADVYHLPIQKETFDTIVASEIIEHVYDPTKFIECLLDILKPKGKIIITTPYDEKIPLCLCVHCNKPTPMHGHLHSFNEAKIRNMINGKVHSFHISKSTNKLLLKIRAYWMIRHLPFKFWHFIDKIAISIFGNPARLIIEIIK